MISNLKYKEMIMTPTHLQLVFDRLGEVEVLEVFSGKEEVPITEIEYDKDKVIICIDKLFQLKMSQRLCFKIVMKQDEHIKNYTFNPVVDEEAYMALMSQESILVVEDIDFEDKNLMIELDGNVSIKERIVSNQIKIALGERRFEDNRVLSENVSLTAEHKVRVRIPLYLFHPRKETNQFELILLETNQIYPISSNLVNLNILEHDQFVSSSNDKFHITLEKDLKNDCMRMSYQRLANKELYTIQSILTERDHFKIVLGECIKDIVSDYSMVLLAEDKVLNLGPVLIDENNESVMKVYNHQIVSVLDDENKSLKLAMMNAHQDKIYITSRYGKAATTYFFSPIVYQNKAYELLYDSNNDLSIIQKEEVKEEKKDSHFAKLPTKLKVKYSVILGYSLLIYGVSLFARLNPKYKGIWLIGEMDHTAQDNGYHFFKYMRENHPDKKCYYTINQNSPDLKNIDYLGHIIYRTTFRHILYLFLAEKHIGTHDYRHWQYPGYANLFDKVFAKRIKGEFIQLQHGVIHMKSERGFHYDKRKYYDKIVVSSDYEKELLNTYFKHPEANLIVTGLSRYDNLVDQSNKRQEKIITVMPTWRKKLRGGRFTETEYYKVWKGILTDKRLKEVLVNHGVVLEFYLHIKLQDYAKLFDKYADETVRIIKQGDKNVQDILKESSLMVTDYSSVSIDFVYMDKPVVFYQFDYLNYLRSYAVLDRYEYEDMRFGYIGTEKEEVVDKMIGYIENNYVLEEKYSRLADKYFKYRDTMNSKRIYEAIK